MATTVYRFYDYRGSTDYKFTATIQVDWSFDQASKKITITGIRYNNDSRPAGWFVASAMKFGIRWSDGTEQVISEGNYNVCGGSSYYCVQQTGAGFVTKAGVLGIFSQVQSRMPVSHTFSGNSGGFTIMFGSTLGTLNYGNPGPYRQLDRVSGPEPGGTFATGPSGTINVSVTNPYVYTINSTASGINWGQGYASSSINARVSYSIDGVNYNYTAYSASGGRSSYSFTVDGRSLAKPWSKVPDDETVTVTWTATTNMGAITGQGTCHCMKSYDAYVIEPGVNDGKPVAADVFISDSVGAKPQKEMRRVNTIG